LPSVTLGKAFAECKIAFAECLRHSAKNAIPVVNCMHADPLMKGLPPDLFKKHALDMRLVDSLNNNKVLFQGHY
jgi:hypothetical protein